MGHGQAAPLIGITGHVTETAAGYRVVAAGEAYIEAVRLAGGLPVLLTPVDGTAEAAAVWEALQHVDGVLLTGGKDIDPERYGEQVLNPRVHIEPGRDAFELPLARLAFERNIPMFGICRGMQVMNVALGGTLWQDIPAQVPEAQAHYQRAHRNATTHDVHILSDSLVGDLTCVANGGALATNSFHHQASRRLAPVLTPVAYTADGLVEAVEAGDRDFAIGVQWHPEHLVQDSEHQLRLFAGLIDAARTHRVKRLTDSR